MSKTCLINQPLGIGDICFTQKIAHGLNKMGYEVTWPVPEDLLYLNDYLISEVKFVATTSHTQVLDYDIILNLQNADRYFAGSVLKAKYRLVDASWEDWATFFNFRRNKEKEDELFDKLCPKNQDYTVICKTVGSPPNHRIQDIYYEKNDNPVVEITLLDGYVPFDYCKIFENASQIGLVDTVWNYIIEKLTLKTEKLWLTSRFQPSNFMHIDKLFKQPWKFIE